VEVNNSDQYERCGQSSRPKIMSRLAGDGDDGDNDNDDICCILVTPLQLFSVM